jgi:hypothetical protein
MLPTLGIAILHNPASAAEPRQVRSLSADLVFNFYCEADSSAAFDDALERFLRQRGFEVLNRPRLLRERNMEVDPLRFSMDAVDAADRMIFIMSTGWTPGAYAVQLYSPPPTRRAEGLEEEILAFVSDKLTCRVGRVVRKKGGPETRDYYRKILEETRARIRDFNGEL